MTKPAIYVASRASIPEHSAMWRRLREEGTNIISTWIDEAGLGSSGSDLGVLWNRISREIGRADRLVLYAELGDFPLKGALVETGIAIGLDKPVYVVVPGCFFQPPDFRPVGSWITHPLVMVRRTVEDAFR